MKIDVDPQALQEIAAYCDDQREALLATSTYLENYGRVYPGVSGALMLWVLPFYGACKGVTMSAFSSGQDLVVSRSEAIKEYIKEQTALESDHTAMLDKMRDQLEQGHLGAAGTAGGSTGGNSSNAGNFSSAGNAGPVGAAIGGVQQSADEQGLNPQPLPPGPPDDMASTMERSQHAEQGLNPQPLPPGPPDDMQSGPASERREVMDTVWQQRSNNDPLGRSPQQLESMWQARQPVEPLPVEQNLESAQTQHQMERMGKMESVNANLMKIASSTQMAATLANLKSS